MSDMTDDFHHARNLGRKAWDRGLGYDPANDLLFMSWSACGDSMSWWNKVSEEWCAGWLEANTRNEPVVFLDEEFA